MLAGEMGRIPNRETRRPREKSEKNREMTTPRDCFGQDLDYAPPAVVNARRGAIARGCVVGSIFSSFVCFFQCRWPKDGLRTHGRADKRLSHRGPGKRRSHNPTAGQIDAECNWPLPPQGRT